MAFCDEFCNRTGKLLKSDCEQLDWLASWQGARCLVAANTLQQLTELCVSQCQLTVSGQDGIITEALFVGQRQQFWERQQGSTPRRSIVLLIIVVQLCFFSAANSPCFDKQAVKMRVPSSRVQFNFCFFFLFVPFHFTHEVQSKSWKWTNAS